MGTRLDPGHHPPHSSSSETRSGRFLLPLAHRSLFPLGIPRTLLPLFGATQLSSALLFDDALPNFLVHALPFASGFQDLSLAAGHQHLLHPDLDSHYLTQPVKLYHRGRHRCLWGHITSVLYYCQCHQYLLPFSGVDTVFELERYAKGSTCYTDRRCSGDDCTKLMPGVPAARLLHCVPATW